MIYWYNTKLTCNTRDKEGKCKHYKICLLFSLHTCPARCRWSNAEQLIIQRNCLSSAFQIQILLLSLRSLSSCTHRKLSGLQECLRAGHSLVLVLLSCPQGGLMQLCALDFLQAFGELALQEVRRSVFQNCKLIERFATN